jgi:ABC-type amino acid transport substrate-binding protein
MSVGKTHFPAVLLLGVAIAVTAFAAGCSLFGSSPNASSSSPLPASAAERARAILGHAPTGLAKAVVDRGSVIVAVDADYPPQSSLDEKTGKPAGFDVDVAEQVGKILGLTVQLRTAVWEMIPADLQRDKYDVAIDSIAITDQSEKVLGLTDPYYYTIGQIFVAKGGVQITSPADLAGRNVGVGAATVFYPWLKENTESVVKTYATDAEALQDLAEGKLDFVMTAGQIGQQAIRSGQPLEFSGKPLSYEHLAFATKQEEADWLELLDYSVRQLHKDGALTAMSKKWFDGIDLTVKE